MSNPSESQDLVTTIDGAVAWLRLDRPRQQNALSFALVEAMDAEVIRLTMDEAVRVLVITGTGSAFCAGVDLKDSGFEEVFRDGADRMKLPLRAHAMMARLRSCPKPIIAALNGTTVAGGLELALACDIWCHSRRRRCRGDAASHWTGAGQAAALYRRLMDS